MGVMLGLYELLVSDCCQGQEMFERRARRLLYQHHVIVSFSKGPHGVESNQLPEAGTSLEEKT